MTVPIGFSGNNNARVYEYDYDRTGRQVGMEVTAANVTSNSTLATASAGSETEFYYDDAKNRVKLITKAGDVYYFVYDPTALVPAVVYEAVDDGETTVTYLNARDPMGGLISRDTYEGAARTQSRTYHFDGLGSTRSLTDEDGVVTDSYTYDEWGNVTNHTGSTADNPYQYVGKLGYYTHYQEPDFEYLQLGVRYYDPGIGRFTQRDPIPSVQVSQFAYSWNQPLTSHDPSGRRPTLNLGPSCTNQYSADYWYAVKEWLNSAMDWLSRSGSFVGQAFDSCDAVIPVQCWKGWCNRQKGLCGQANTITGKIKVSSIEGGHCPPMFCVILHEAAHICGVAFHRGEEWDYFSTPECGNLWEVSDEVVK